MVWKNQLHYGYKNGYLFVSNITYLKILWVFGFILT